MGAQCRYNSVGCTSDITRTAEIILIGAQGNRRAAVPPLDAVRARTDRHPVERCVQHVSDTFEQMLGYDLAVLSGNEEFVGCVGLGVGETDDHRVRIARLDSLDRVVLRA